MAETPLSGPAEEVSGFVWRPTPEQAARSHLGRFMARHGISSFPELLERSTQDIEWFWDAVNQDLDLEWHRPYERVVDLSRGYPWPRWFPEGQFNYVHNAVDRRATATPQAPALIWEGEEGSTATLSYSRLAEATDRAAAALKSLGIGKGDRVGVFMPMMLETAVATLACSKIGAIYIPIFSGYGLEAVATRLQDADARLLITADSFFRRGKAVPMKEIADKAVVSCPSVEQVLVVRRLGIEVPWRRGRDVWWHEALARASGPCPTERTEAEDPFMIIYTSGTTGRPKGALHTHCGFPIKAAQDMAHGFDVGPGDVLFWLTDIGWMMGPWAIIGGLLLGATVLLYDGTPDYPDPGRLWSIVERHRATILGISPTAVRALMRSGEEWVRRHDLSSLRILGSTGEPWNPGPWLWYFQNVGGGRLPIINYSGGTEVSGGIVCGNPVTPIKPCSFAGPVPGMAADVVDEECRPLRGTVGELVVRKPWVGMTKGFWKDPDRYIATYWSRWPEVWWHGDFARIDEDGCWFIEGRSDDTLKIAGKRVGPAEIESVVVAHPAVSEAAAVGVPHAVKGEVVAVFAVLRPGASPSDALRAEIQELVATRLGKPLQPDTVRFVADLPKTRNAKIMRRVIRAKFLGQADLGDLSSLENPQALEEIAASR